MHFQAPIRLPEHVSVQVVVVKVQAVIKILQIYFHFSHNSSHFIFTWAETGGHPADRPCDKRADKHDRVRALMSRWTSFTETRFHSLTCLSLSFSEWWWVDLVSLRHSLFSSKSFRLLRFPTHLYELKKKKNTLQRDFLSHLFLPTERDAFDTLLDHAPDKLNVVKTVMFPSGALLLPDKENVWKGHNRC